MKKKKIGIVLSVVLALSLMLVPLTGCGLIHGFFGLFSTGNGHRLTSFVPSDATALSMTAARTATEGFAVTPSTITGASLIEPFSAEEEDEEIVELDPTFPIAIEYVRAIQAIYGGANFLTHFWTADSRGNLIINEEQDLGVIGDDFERMLMRNDYFIAGNVRIPNIVLLPGVVDWAEQHNLNHRYVGGVAGGTVRAEWFRSPTGFEQVVQFFTLMVDGEQYVVMQTNAFVEVPSGSIGGGGSAQVLRQNQAMYNSQGRLVRFQSSTGIRTHMGRGTEYQGHNFEVFINWSARSDGNTFA